MKSDPNRELNILLDEILEHLEEQGKTIEAINHGVSFINDKLWPNFKAYQKDFIKYQKHIDDLTSPFFKNSK